MGKINIKKEIMGPKGNKMIDDAYAEYLKVPKASSHRHDGTIYRQGWCVEIGKACRSPHPHRHFTFDEFIEQVMSDDEFKNEFLPDL